ncbi:MAG: WYL domain-containing protein [Bacteroidales bacterium]|jgi:predicted DNA-binding transcriptional regulator YafY|nr:WYL domain-containing protein [Bacteroidales bacterium]
MQNYVLLKRFALIIEKLNNHKAPTLREISDSLNDAGYEVSARTLQRDFEHLRSYFGLEIEYEHDSRAYRIQSSQDAHFETLLRLIRLINTSELLVQSLTERDKTMSIVSFQDSVRGTAGSKYLETLFTAIKDNRLVSFEYESFSHNKQAAHTVKPLMLKEYSDNWYLVAVPNGTDDIRIYGLDRMEKLFIEKKQFNAKKYETVAELFQHVIGLVYDVEELAEVRLAAVPEQARYFIKSPLHHSQQVISKSNTEVVFSYQLVPNLELQRLILGYGSRVKVLKPDWFVTQVKKEIKTMLKQYP